ncbi:MAG: HDOD domain-containing protein [Defluviitaleaceae bacterium]|nr:HDOD domain-containing protein [Defluviitaleaceae bacterium]
MKLLIVAKPILNNNSEIMFYCFRYQQSREYLNDHPARMLDFVVSLPCLTVLEEVGLNGFTNGHPLFVPINQYSLLSDLSLQCSQSPEKIVFLLDEQTPPENMYIECINKLKDKGFRFAIENVSDYEFIQPIVSLCDYILISFYNGRDGLSEFKKVSAIYKNSIFIASNVNDKPTFERIRFSGFSGFEGKFYRLAATKGGNTIAPVKVNRIQLINLVKEMNFSTEEVVKIVSRDPSLSISLIKLVNSPHHGLSQKIKSIPQAVALLGQTEVRKWVITAMTGLLADDKPSEITRVSLMRAKFAENLAPLFQMEKQAQELFLMGLFSILDAVLEMSMYAALKIVSVSDPIQEALIYIDGEYAPVYRFILSYETADWTETKRLITINNIEVEDVYKAYLDAVQWYDMIASMEIDAN